MINLIIISIFLNLLILIFFNKIINYFKITDTADGKRKFQKHPVYLFGGTILFINLILFFILNLFNIQDYNSLSLLSTREIISLIFGSIFFYIFGLYDDKYKLSPNQKLTISLILVTCFVLIDNKLIIEELEFSFLSNVVVLKTFSHFFTILAILLFVNALNMFDGINLQTGFYCIVIFSIFILKNCFPDLSINLIIPILLYLYLNFKNKIYFGESGIQLLAFLISYIFIKSNNYNSNFYAEEIFIIMGIPGLDMFRLFIVRLISGHHPFKPDTNHIHHLMLRYFSKNTSFLLIFIYIISTILLYYTIVNKFLYLIGYLFFYIVVITSLYKIKKRKN